MSEHTLKCWSPYYDAVKSGEKNFEVRLDDRGFQKGDTLVLQRFNPEMGVYVGGQIRRRITYVLTGGHFGIEPGFVVMGLEPPGDE